MVDSRKLSQDFLLKSINKDLKAISTPEMRKGQEKFFKEQVRFIGCSLWGARKVAAKYRKLLKEDGWSYDDVLELCESLLRKDTFEEKTVAFAFVEARHREFRRKDFRRFESWLKKYVDNWAHTDHIAPHIIGPLISMYPDLQPNVYRWTRSKNRWLRRAACVSYVIHGRRGRFKDQIFDTADALLDDKDDLVQKGVGWLLKETSKADERAVVAYLMKNRSRTSRLVLRYATEKVSRSDRERVLKGRLKG